MEKFKFSVAYFIDKNYHTKIKELLEIIEANYDSQWGFTYELNSKIKNYYSNVHATVSFSLLFSDLITEEFKDELANTLLKLRSNNPSPVFLNVKEDMNAWDTLEGPNVFSTALSCYTLLHLNSRIDLSNSILWLISEKNDNDLWSYRKDSNINYVITMYVIMAFILFKASHGDSQKGQICLSDVISNACQAIKKQAKKDLGYIYWCGYSDQNICISNTIAALYTLHISNDKDFKSYFSKAKPFLDRTILNYQEWYLSLLSKTEQNDQIKVMYSYNPAYLPLLLKMGYDPIDPVIVKMFNWVNEDIKNKWHRTNIYYPWKSSDSLIQSFIGSLAIYAIISWIREYSKLSQSILKHSKQISLRDVFICHASEDKTRYVNYLKKVLEDYGVSIWYDEGEISWGDNITKKINEGIESSQLAIICFSRAFLKKKWPNSEFSALFNRQQEFGKKIVLPLFLNSRKEILAKYPLLQGISYRKWERKVLDSLAKEILIIIKNRR